jgi:putative ABC transport system permease protein
MTPGSLAVKMLWRESRSGELRLLMLALLLAVSSSTAISLFADRLQRTMTTQAAEFLAADLAITSSIPIASGWQQQATALGLQQAQTVEFPSVLLENQEMLLASAKAVSDHYPLRGHLQISDADFANETTVQQGPPPGEIWVENRILTALKLKLADNLTVGEKQLVVTKVLSYEPDKRGNLFSFSPRVMLNLADLEATRVILPGSRVHYVFQFAGDETAINKFRDWLKPQLIPGQRLQDIHEDRPELGAALSRAEQYLGLSSVVVVLIAGVAIAMTTHRYTERQFNATALLRSLGCSRGEVLYLYLCQFLLLGVAVCSAGCLAGWLVQQGLMSVLAELLPPQPASPGVAAIFFGFGNGMAILFGFALPPLLRLQQVSPLRVLRRELSPLPASSWLIYGLAFSLMAVLIWRYTDDLKLTALILGVGLAAMLGLGWLIYGLLKLATRQLQHLSLRWRFALRGLLRNRRASVGQILAFGITLAAMALSFMVRTELLNNWQKQLPERAPNHFALNILPEQLQGFQVNLQQAQIDAKLFYPVVRGRLTAVNGSPVQERVSKDSPGQEATQRELSLTTASTLPEDNRITAGAAWQAEKPGEVSVEQKLADSLKLQIGDQLTFAVGEEQFTASVINFRSVKWDTMQPNFYMIFSPATLDSYPSTYLTSFYLDRADKYRLNGLLKKYPALTILEVDQILQQFKTILGQLTQAINLLLVFALLAGFAVLFAAVYATLDQRIYEGALMRTLGARLGFLRGSQLCEFLLLGALAGVLAAIAGEAVLYALYTRLMHIDYHPTPYLWLALPLIGAVSVGVAGYCGVRQVFRHAPLPILRRLQ